jgi:predicted outer membrane protein
METSMRKTTILASLFATGSLFALAAATPASAQTYYDQGPFGPIGDVVTAPVAAAGAIVDAPLAAATAPVAIVTSPAIQTSRTAAFVDNAMPNINFLNDSSRMALDHSGDPAIRRFAHRIAVDQTIAGNSMTAWADTNPLLLTGRSAYAGDPITGLATLPINAVISVGSAVTGGTIVASNDGRALLSSEAQDLSRLSALNGPEFDRLYRATERDSLRQLITLYSDYAVNGDDPGLRSLARSQLPILRMRLSEINRI